jgi:plastocyanin
MGFDPSVIHPQAGDSIVFEFRSGVHSAVRKLNLSVDRSLL